MTVLLIMQVLTRVIPPKKKELIARIKLGNTLILTSQGIAFLHSGQERGRTKPNMHHAVEECLGAFVRNSYDASDSINRFIWELDEDYAHVLSYTQGLIALRKRFKLFRIGDVRRIAHAAAFLPAEAAGPVGAFGYTLEWDDGIWYLLFNASMAEQSFIPPHPVKNPVFFAAKDAASPDGIERVTGVTVDKNRIVVDSCTAVIFRSE